MKVRMNAFEAEPSDLVEEELAAVERVIRSGRWILGEEVAGFEAAWATHVGAPHAVGVGNGMDALEIGLVALGVTAGDEVITTPMTAFATVLAIIRIGAAPVLADIDPLTAMLDPASVQRCISDRTRAIVLVHLYGQAGPVAALSELCERNRITLVEDCAQAHGALVDARPVGSFGEVAAWSFYPTKNLGAIGDAGAMTTSSDAIADRAKVLRNYGQSERYVHTEIGLNSRLDEVQAAVLTVRLARLSGWIDARRKVASRYLEAIDHPLIELLPPPASPERHVHHLFVVRCRERSALRDHLVDHGVECLSHYPIAIHQQPPTGNVRTDPEGLPTAEHHAATCLSLPCHPHLSDEEVEHVIATVNSFPTAG